MGGGQLFIAMFTASFPRRAGWLRPWNGEHSRPRLSGLTPSSNPFPPARCCQRGALATTREGACDPPVRPPQTAIGRCWRTATNWDIAGERARPGGRFQRRAASPENSPAIHGWDSMPAIFPSPARDERSLQTATIVHGHHVFCRPSRDFFICSTRYPAMNGWAIVNHHYATSPPSRPSRTKPVSFCPFDPPKPVKLALFATFRGFSAITEAWFASSQASFVITQAWFMASQASFVPSQAWFVITEASFMASQASVASSEAWFTPSQASVVPSEASFVASQAWFMASELWFVPPHLTGVIHVRSSD